LVVKLAVAEKAPKPHALRARTRQWYVVVSARIRPTLWVAVSE
jgi:hypothetical protein